MPFILVGKPKENLHAWVNLFTYLCQGTKVKVAKLDKKNSHLNEDLFHRKWKQSPIEVCMVHCTYDSVCTFYKFCLFYVTILLRNYEINTVTWYITSQDLQLQIMASPVAYLACLVMGYIFFSLNCRWWRFNGWGWGLWRLKPPPPESLRPCLSPLMKGIPMYKDIHLLW